MNLVENVIGKMKKVISGEVPEAVEVKTVNEKRKFTCSWLFDSIVVLCDGSVVCGCADAHGKKVLGNIKDQSVRDIWNSEKVRKIRRGLNEGYTSFCEDCILRCFLDEDAPVEQRPEVIDSIPRLFIEPTIICNLSCYDAICGFNSDIVSKRRKKMISMEEFRKVVDQVGDMVERLHLFNYGEPFVHPEAVDMIEYAKSNYPQIYVFTSTNGMMLNEEKIERLVKAGMDDIAVSIDGCDQKSYIKYRIGGDFSKAIKVLEIFQQKKRELGIDKPFINWRYILFKWNHSLRQRNKAVAIAEKLGIERLTWEITNHPAGAKSEKYQVGTKAWKKIYYELWESGGLCNAIKSKQYRSKIEMESPKPKMKANSSTEINLKVKNVGGFSWHNVSDTAVGWVRVGAQLHDERKRLINMDYSRSFIKRVMNVGDEDSINMVLPPINEEGKYFIKFDMVLEGIQWFETAGNSVTWVPLKIKGQ